MSAEVIDLQLQRDRQVGRTKRTYKDELASLPNGTYVAIDRSPWLVWENNLLAWSAGQYLARRARSQNLEVEVLTPRSIVTVFTRGYRPEVHPSATALLLA